jgi:hypothetical protein
LVFRYCLNEGASMLRTQAASLASWVRRYGADEHGTNIVEYVAITGIALIVVGTIVVALVAGRFRVGQVMADSLDTIVISFSVGRPGQVNIDTSLYPKTVAPQRPAESFAIVPSWPDVAAIPLTRLVVGLPMLVVQPAGRQHDLHYP